MIIIMIAFDIAILKVTLNVNWEPLILSAVGRLVNYNLYLTPGPGVEPGSSALNASVLPLGHRELSWH